MLRPTLVCTLLAVSFLPACTTEQPADELADETAQDGESGKGDTADAFTYFTVTPDKRACSFNSRCGGFFVARPNRATTTCGRGSTASRCYVDSLDLSHTGMPASVQTSYKERIRNGESFLLRGDIAPAPDDRGASLAVTEVWVAGSATGSTEEGVFTFVKDNGLRCITAPCPTITETRLNSNRSANIHALDFSDSGADEAAQEHAQNAVFDDGVIVVGYRYYPTSRSKGRTANQFFAKAPVPLH
jgi:hypothetical protein